jgi:hypothetical protein
MKIERPEVRAQVAGRSASSYLAVTSRVAFGWVIEWRLLRHS